VWPDQRWVGGMGRQVGLERKGLGLPILNSSFSLPLVFPCRRCAMLAMIQGPHYASQRWVVVLTSRVIVIIGGHAA